MECGLNRSNVPIRDFDIYLGHISRPFGVFGRGGLSEQAVKGAAFRYLASEQR